MKIVCRLLLKDRESRDKDEKKMANSPGDQASFQMERMDSDDQLVILRTPSRLCYVYPAQLVPSSSPCLVP